jgi:hypothetical protein
MALQVCAVYFRDGAVNADLPPDITVSQLLLHPDNQEASSISPARSISQDWIDAPWNNLPAILSAGMPAQYKVFLNLEPIRPPTSPHFPLFRIHFNKSNRWYNIFSLA